MGQKWWQSRHTPAGGGWGGGIGVKGVEGVCGLKVVAEQIRSCGWEECGSEGEHMGQRGSIWVKWGVYGSREKV